MNNLEMLRIMERSLEALEEGFVVSGAFKLRDAIDQAKADLDAQAPKEEPNRPPMTHEDALATFLKRFNLEMPPFPLVADLDKKAPSLWEQYAQDTEPQAPDIPDDEKEAIIKAANEWDEMHEST